MKHMTLNHQAVFPPAAGFTGGRTVYSLRPLNEGHISQMMMLQNAAGDGEIIPRSRDALRAHFAEAGNGGMGIFHKGRLVAQMLFFTEEGAETCRLGCIAVHPSQRGKGLMGAMLSCGIALAEEFDFDSVQARVRVGNDVSLNNFLRAGFKIAAQGPSPEDAQRTVHFVAMNLKPLRL